MPSGPVSRGARSQNEISRQVLVAQVRLQAFHLPLRRKWPPPHAGRTDTFVVVKFVLVNGFCRNGNRMDRIPGVLSGSDP